MSGLKVCITGHTGFIGKYLMKHLEDIEVVGISRSASENDAVKSIELDITKIDEGKLELYRNSLEGTDAIIHLSAYRPVVRSKKKDSFVESMKLNVGGTLKTLKMTKKFKISKLIFASTKSVYGNFKGLVTEDAPTSPNTNYGKSKLLAEKLCKTFAEVYEIRCTSLRISSVFGPGMPCNLVFSIFLNTALNDETVFVHRHLSGYESLDLVYIKDAATAIEKALHKEQGRSFEVFNIGGRSPKNTFELATEIINTVGSKSRIEVIHTKERRKGVKLSIEKASTVLDWTPKYDIKSAIEDLLPRWYCENITRL